MSRLLCFRVRAGTHGQHVWGRAVLTLAALGVVCTQAEEARLTSVTAGSVHMEFAATLTSHQSQRRVCVTVAHATMLGAVRVTVTCWGTGS